MKIKGKERTVYDPKWCCEEFELWVLNCDYFHLKKRKVVLRLEGSEVETLIEYCPFCGEKIEV